MLQVTPLGLPIPGSERDEASNQLLKSVNISQLAATIKIPIDAL